MMPIDFNPGSVNATAYAAKLPNGKRIVAIVNKDATQPLPISLPEFSVGHTLSAPGLDSTKVQLSDAKNNREVSTVPPATAVLFYASRA